MFQFEFLCCLMMPGLNKDIQCHTQHLYSYPKSENPKPKPKQQPEPNSASYKGSSESKPFSKIASQTTKPSVRSNPSAKNTSSKQTTNNTNTSSPARKVATAKRDLSGNLDIRLYINPSTGKRKIPDTTPEKNTQVKKTSS